MDQGLPGICAEDQRACEALIHAFCHFIDHGQAHRVVELFTPQGVFERRGEALRGHEALAQAMARRSPQVLTRHVCTGTVLRAEGAGRIGGTTSFLFFRRVQGDAADPSPAACLAAVGDYFDVFERTPAGWRFASRRAVPVFQQAGGS